MPEDSPLPTPTIDIALMLKTARDSRSLADQNPIENVRILWDRHAARWVVSCGYSGEFYSPEIDKAVAGAMRRARGWAPMELGTAAEKHERYCLGELAPAAPAPAPIAVADAAGVTA